MITTVVEWMPEQQAYRVSVYRDGALSHRAWFAGEASANFYATKMRLNA